MTTIIIHLMVVGLLIWTTTPPSESYITSSLASGVQILVVIVAIGVLTIMKGRLLVEHVFVFYIFVQVTEIANVLSNLRLGHLHIQGLFDSG